MKITKKRIDFMNGQNPQFDTKTRLCCVLAYFSILFFLPLVFYNDNSRARFHANQGLVLFISVVVINVLIALINIVIPSPEVKNAIYTIFNLVAICFSILGVLHVVNEQDRPLPIIGKITIIK